MNQKLHIEQYTQTLSTNYNNEMYLQYIHSHMNRANSTCFKHMWHLAFQHEKTDAHRPQVMGHCPGFSTGGAN